MVNIMNPFVGINSYLETEGNDNPWLASATYEEKDEYRFKGRKEDTSKILSMLQQNECVVCYAASGDGKSSLVNAGLCPAMRRIGLFPIKITFSTDEYNGKGLPFMSEDTSFVDFDKLMMAKINQAVENYRRDFMATHNIDGGYDIIFEKISKYENVDISDSLWWKLRTETIQIPFGVFDYIPVIIFDQFEEIFRATWKAEFFRWLEKLMRETCPNEVAVKYNGSRDDLPSKRLFKLIFSMRYEYIGELDYWCSQRFYIPQLLKDRYFLRALNLEQAKQVIVEQSCGDEYALSTIRDKANEILKILSDERNCGLNNTPDGISAILLSILCYTYYKQIIKDNNTDLPSAKDLVKVFYNNICKCFFQNTPDLISLIERALVNSDGKRNRIRWRNVHELDVIIAKYEEKSFTIGNILLLTNLIRKHDINNEEYIEFAHDKIAEVVKEKLDNEDIIEIQRRNRKKNIEKRRNIENVLTVYGRELFNNQYYVGESNSERQSALSAILHITENSISNTSETAYRTSITELLKGSFLKDRMIGMTIMKDEEGLSYHEHPFKDGVYYVIAGLIESGENKGKVEKVRFLDQQRRILYTRNGYCGIDLEYDDNGNEISRVFVDENNNPTYNIHCYAEIRRKYDSNNMPIETRFYSPDRKNLSAHFEGNYGYDSEYDNNGNEIRRIFIGDDGKPCQLSNGIWGQEYGYNSENQIIFICNLDKKKERVSDDSGCISVRFSYDKRGNVVEEVCCDEKLNPILNNKGYCILRTNYNNLGLIESQDYYDVNGTPVMRTDGYFRLRIDYDNNGWPISISYHDINGNCVITEGGAIVKRAYDEIGLEKEIRFLAPDGTPMYIKDGRCCIKIEYGTKNKLPETYTFCNHKGEIVLTKEDCVCKRTRVWDEAGRHYIKEEFFNNSIDEPLEVSTYEWSNPFEYNIHYTKGGAKQHIKLNYNGNPIYEEDLLGQLQYHHKCLFYNEKGWLVKELLFNKDNTQYINEMGDVGLEFIYNESGQQCGEASIGENGERHINNEGWAVKIWKEKIDKNHVNKNYYYYDVDGITPILIKKGYHKYVEGDDGYEATYGIDEKPINNNAGYAKCKVKHEAGEVSFSYYDKDNVPVCNNGYHRIVFSSLCKEMSDIGLYDIDYYNEKNEPVDIDGFSHRHIRKSGLFSFSNYIMEYTDSTGKLVDGPNPLGKEHPKGCKFYFNSDIEPYYGVSQKSKVILGNYWKENMQNILLIVLLTLYIPFYSVYYLCKSCFNNLKRTKKVDTIRLVSIKEIISQETTSIANHSGLLPGDIILSYGGWVFTDFNSPDDAINSFETAFNEKNNVYKPITIGRVHEDDESEPETSSFWVPGNIGVQLYDEVREDASGKIAALLRKFKNTYNS